MAAQYLYLFHHLYKTTQIVRPRECLLQSASPLQNSSLHLLLSPIIISYSGRDVNRYSQVNVYQFSRIAPATPQYITTHYIPTPPKDKRGVGVCRLSTCTHQHARGRSSPLVDVIYIYKCVYTLPLMQPEEWL